MGAAIPVVGSVVGGISAISQLNAQKKQAEAQRNAIDQQVAASDANTKMRLIELERQKLYANYQGQIGTIQRELSKVQDDQQLQLARIQDAATAQQQRFELESGNLTNQVQNQAMLGDANQTEAAARQEAFQQKGAGLNQAQDIFSQLANQLAALDQEQVLAKQARESATAMYAGQGTQGLSQSDMATLAASLLDQSEGAQQGIQNFNVGSNAALQSILQSKEFADIIQGMGAQEADFLRGTAARQADYLNAATGYNLLEVENQRKLREQELNRLKNNRDAAYTIDEAQAKLNESFYDAQNQSQRSLVQSAGLSERAQLSAQRQSIQSPNAFTSLLGPAIGIAQSVTPLFRSRTQPGSITSLPQYNGNQMGGFTGATVPSGFLSGYRG